MDLAVVKKSLSSKKIRLQEQITLVSQLYTKLKEDLFILDGELAKLSAPIPAVSKQLKPTIPNPPGSAPVSVIKKKSFKDIYLAQQIKLEDQDIHLESHSDMRVHSLCHSPKLIEQELAEFTFIPIKDITNHWDGHDIYIDWFTFGVIYHRSRILKTFTNEKDLVVMWVTDLKGGFFRLVLAEAACKALQNEEIGSVIGLLNPKLILPSQSDGAICLYLDDAGQYVKIGMSADLDWCKYEKCQEIINGKSKAQNCSTHRDSRYHKALGSRQELAVGTQSFIVGNPSSTASKAKVRAIKNQAVYLVGKDTVVSEGLKISMRPPLEPTSQSASTEQLSAILKSHGRGGDLIRKAMGIEMEIQEAPVFGPTSLLKMKCNPYTMSERNSPKKSPAKASPSKPLSQIDSPLKAVVQKDSPLKRARKADSDDGYELVIN